MGFQPRADGFEIAPQLPQAWPSLTIRRIHLHGQVLDITAGKREITFSADGPPVEPFFVYLPRGRWAVTITGPDGQVLHEATAKLARQRERIPLKAPSGSTVRLKRI